MDPDVIRIEWWDQLARVMVYLYLFTGLGLTAAFAFLLAHAVIPSLVASDHAPAEVQAFRRVLYPVAAVALVLTGYAFAQALYLAIDVLRQYYPRFWY